MWTIDDDVKEAYIKSRLHETISLEEFDIIYGRTIKNSILDKQLSTRGELGELREPSPPSEKGGD